MILQSITMQFHSINVMVELEETELGVELEHCDHTRLALLCDPNTADGMLSIALNPRKMVDEYRSADSGLTLTLDFTQKEAEVLLYTIERVLRQWRWNCAHPAPEYVPSPEPPP